MKGNVPNGNNDVIKLPNNRLIVAPQSAAGTVHPLDRVGGDDEEPRGSVKKVVAHLAILTISFQYTITNHTVI